MESIESILEKTKIQLTQKMPFAIYCKPESVHITAFFQINAHKYCAKDFTETGFVFAPFEGKEHLLIPENESEIRCADFHSSEILADIIEAASSLSEKQDFKNLVQKAIDAIKSGQFSKVVLSRKEIVEIGHPDISSLFEKLLHAYPAAFRYCWYHPEVGLWLGATPERLLKSEGNQFYTMALAGTQKFEGREIVEWHFKEKAEQQFVTEYIVDHLKGHVAELSVSQPFTAKAGNLLHLRTDVRGVLKTSANLRQIIEILHPTPAVCGLPKAVAKQFILENEGYDRSFYSGFLGELNHDYEHGKIGTDLYVNLRCMQIKKSSAHLYMGCGITNDSDPEKEYSETMNKSLTMKKILL